jgi:hypothetical protein
MGSWRMGRLTEMDVDGRGLVMTMVLAIGRFLTDYARRPLHVVLLVVVPLVLVVATSSALQSFARVLGSTTPVLGIQAASAGWAAALIAGIGGFFHVRGSLLADRRLATAGAGGWSVVGARLGSGMVLALLAGGGSLLALAARASAAVTAASVTATLAAAWAYFGLGALVGAVIADEAGGSLLLALVWFIDVFVGPTMGTHGAVTAVLPDHFPTMLASEGVAGAGVRADLLGSLSWAAALLAAAGALLGARVGAWQRRRAGRSRLAIAVRASFVEYARSPLLWALLVIAPAALISLSIAITPNRPTPLHAAGMDQVVSMARLHGAVMVPIAVGFLAGVTGLLVVLGAIQADRRLVLAGFHPVQVLTGRVAVVVAGTVLATAVALAVTAAGLTPRSWPLFALSALLVGLTYATFGVLLGPLTGKLGGIFLILAVPFIDIGVGQDPMLAATLPGWGRLLPSHPASMLLLRAAFGTGVNWAQVGAALGWLVVLGAGAGAVFWLRSAGRHRPGRSAGRSRTQVRMPPMRQEAKG